MKKCAILLIAGLLCSGAFAKAKRDQSFNMVEAELAFDSFATCFEPELKDDPVIAAPIDVWVGYREFDNSVSNAAFAKCESRLSFDSNGPKSKWNRYSGARLFNQRSVFYASRGFLDLNERKRMLPFFICADQVIKKSKKIKTLAERKALQANVLDSCKAFFIEYSRTDKGEV